MSSRRSLILGTAALLGGCGFQPVYGPGGERRADPTTGLEPALLDAMASVRVGLIPERNGQLLRRELQRQLEDRRPGSQARYDLAVSYAANTEILGYRRDGTITRVRLVATANWILATAAIPPEVVDRGSARTLDAYNIPDLQFFAADASREDMERRLIAELSERVVLGVSVALRRRLASA